MLTDIEIAQATEPKPIGEIAAIAGVDEKYLELYKRIIFSAMWSGI